MKQSRFAEEQIIGIVKDGGGSEIVPGERVPTTETGVSVAGLCRKPRVSDATVYKWQAGFGGMNVSEVRRLRALQDQNAKRKRLLADTIPDTVAPKDLLGENGDAYRKAGSGCAFYG